MMLVTHYVFTIFMTVTIGVGIVFVLSSFQQEEPHEQQNDEILTVLRKIIDYFTLHKDKMNFDTYISLAFTQSKTMGVYFLSFTLFGWTLQ